MKALRPWLWVAVALSLTGCAQLLGNLRRDLDDSDPYAATPTVGGRWTERNMLGSAEDSAVGGMYEERYAAVGHAERGPASVGLRQSGRKGWLDDAPSAQAQADPAAEGEEGPSFSSVSSLPPSTRRSYKNGARATRSDFVDDATNEGSLWASDGQTNYYFTKNKIRGVGDIVAVTVEKDLYRDVLAEVGRSLSPREKDAEIELAQARLQARAQGLPEPDAPATGAQQDQVAASNAAPNRAPAAAPGAPAQEGTQQQLVVRAATAADIDIARSLSFKPGEQIMSEIVERYPNGNYKIRGTRRLPYRNGYRMLSMVGIVKGSDIGDDDAITSGKLYEYRLEVIR